MHSRFGDLFARRHRACSEAEDLYLLSRHRQVERVDEPRENGVIGPKPPVHEDIEAPR